MRLLPLARRIARMSADEIRTRSRQAICSYFDVLTSRIGIDPCRISGSDFSATGAFFCPPDDVPAIAEILRRRMPEATEQLMAWADAVRQRRFHLLGYRDLDFGAEIRWALDPVHDLESSRVPWPSVPYLDFELSGDHKIVWELSRHQFLIRLAQAYRISGREKYIDCAQQLWLDWQSANPYPLGINWASTLEVAFRSLSWLWVDFLLEGVPGHETWRRQIAIQLERAGWYINRYLSTYFAPNTHLLGEAVALFVIACRYPGFRRAEKWRNSAWEIILQACRSQVRADGFYFEQSTYYHTYALDFFLQARLIAARNGIQIPEVLDRTIQSMSVAIVRLGQGGALPRFGDDDGGRVFDGRRNTAAEMDDPLSTAAVLYGDPVLRAAAGSLREETLWLLGPDSARQFDSLSSSPLTPHSDALRESGFYILLDPASPPAQLTVDAGEQGSLAAGHGHADALSVQLIWKDRRWLTDPGTCCYLGPDGRRDRFRGTAAHNTITVDSMDQAAAGRSFSWGSLPQIEAHDWITGSGFDLFHGSHSGYTRLPDPVTHHRWVIRFGSRMWLVRDVLTGTGAHEFGIHWHFEPDCQVTSDGKHVLATLPDKGVLTLTAARGDSTSYGIEQDEFSPVYGQHVPAPTARASFHAACPVEIGTVLTLADEPASAASLTHSKNDAVSVWVYEYGSCRCRMYFAGASGRWHYESWETDANFLYVLETEEGSVLHAVRASFLRCADRVVLDSNTPVPLWEGPLLPA